MEKDSSHSNTFDIAKAADQDDEISFFCLPPPPPLTVCYRDRYQTIGGRGGGIDMQDLIFSHVSLNDRSDRPSEAQSDYKRVGASTTYEMLPQKSPNCLTSNCSILVVGLVA